MSYTIEQVAKMDQEMHELNALYSKAKIGFGLEIARRLKVFENYKLYLKLDSQSYPNFPTYLKSIGINYKSARELIGLYETFVEIAGFTIKELADIGYHKLTIIKPKLFTKETEGYKLLVSKSEVKRWVAEADSDITQEDLRQKVKEETVGEHDHEFIYIRRCKLCHLKEIINRE